MSDLAEAVLAGEHRALARAITRIENRSPGYRDLVSMLYPHAGDAEIVGITGSPGAGKSTLVDELADRYRSAGRTVGVIAVDPASPFTGGAVLGDRIRMGKSAGDMDVFVRSMSARGRLGGLSTATADAVTALDAFGKDVVIIETVGAGQNEVDIVRTADTVVVLVPPKSGDAVQMLKAGILEIGDVFLVNKADLDGADRTVSDLREMVEEGAERAGSASIGIESAVDDGPVWKPPVLETVATTGEGLEAMIEAIGEHRTFLEEAGLLDVKARSRAAAEIRALLHEDLAGIVESEITRSGGMDALAEAVSERESDPYTVVDELLAPLRAALAQRREVPPERDP